MRSEIKVQLRADLRDPEGNTIKRYPWKKANSLMAAFIKILYTQMTQTSQTVADVTNTPIAASSNAQNLNLIATAANTDRGTVIGTGETPVALTNYKLEAQVTANITHSSGSFALEAPDGSTYILAIIRSFTNLTGSSLPIREVGLYCLFGPTLAKICIDRTLYSVNVPNNLSVTLTYRIIISL